MLDSVAGIGTIAFNTQPTKDWTCADWKFWHEELVKAFKGGKFSSGIRYNNADALRLSNQVFNEWWDKLIGFWSSKKLCGYESSFYNYFYSVGNDRILSYLQAILTPVATGAGTVVTNVADAAGNTAKTLKWLVPTLLVVGSGVVIYFGVQYAKNKSKK